MSNYLEGIHRNYNPEKEEWHRLIYESRNLEYINYDVIYSDDLTKSMTLNAKSVAFSFSFDDQFVDSEGYVDTGYIFTLAQSVSFLSDHIRNKSLYPKSMCLSLEYSVYSRIFKWQNVLIVTEIEKESMTELNLSVAIYDRKTLNKLVACSMVTQKLIHNNSGNHIRLTSRF